jgi:hypothetical protein
MLVQENNRIVADNGTTNVIDEDSGLLGCYSE